MNSDSRRLQCDFVFCVDIEDQVANVGSSIPQAGNLSTADQVTQQSESDLESVSGIPGPAEWYFQISEESGVRACETRSALPMGFGRSSFKRLPFQNRCGWVYHYASEMYPMLVEDGYPCRSVPSQGTPKSMDLHRAS